MRHRFGLSCGPCHDGEAVAGRMRVGPDQRPWWSTDAMTTRADCVARDKADPIAALRSLFALERVDEEGIIYLDGNSLGVLPRATAVRLRAVVEDEWGVGLIRSWNEAGWIEPWLLRFPLRTGLGDVRTVLLGCVHGFF